MNDNGRIAVPGHVDVKTMFRPGLNAEPVTVELRDASGIQVAVFGGETKLERHAAAILAALLRSQFHSDDLVDHRDDLVDEAIDMAERLHVALQRKAEEQQAAQEAPKLDGV